MNKLYKRESDGQLSEMESIPNCNIYYYGENSIIIIGKESNISNMRIFIGEGGYLEIGDFFRVRFSLNIDMKAPDTTVKIGNNCNIGRGEILAGDDKGLKVLIGDDFLTSLDFYIRNSDGHVIIDQETNEVVNKSYQGIVIGKHVWIGYDVKILKDVYIPDNCIVGTGAVVTKNDYVENSIIVGVPAKTLRTNVRWDSRNYDKYMGN